MRFEIITVENGDVLHETQDREEALREIFGYVEENRADRPGIEREVALLVFDEDGQRVGPALWHAQLVAGHRPPPVRRRIRRWGSREVAPN